MNTDAIEKLRKRIDKNVLEDEDDLLLYMALASRMKALGNAEKFEKITEIIQRPEFVGKVDDILKERCQRGIWDVRERMGEELGFAIITAQDFWMLYHYASGKLFSVALNPWFEEWAHETSMAEIDEETLEIIENFKETYALPEELLLPVVDAPVTETEYELLGQIADQIPVRKVSGKWLQRNYEPNTPPHYADVSALTVACDDDTPSRALLRSQYQLTFQMETERGLVSVQRGLTSDWKLVLEMEDSAGNVLKADFVRVGILPFRWQEDDRCWVLDLRPFEGKNRRALLCAKTVVRLNPVTVLEIEN